MEAGSRADSRQEEGVGGWGGQARGCGREDLRRVSERLSVYQKPLWPGGLVVRCPLVG